MRWRFVDRILAFEPFQSIMVLKAGSLEEYGLLDRWGERGLAPAILQLESCVEAARWLVEASSGFTLSARPQGVEYWRNPRGLAPGERLAVLLWVTERSDESLRLGLRLKNIAPGEQFFPDRFRGKAGEPDGLFSVSFTPLAELRAADERQILWEEIRP